MTFLSSCSIRLAAAGRFAPPSDILARLQAAARAVHELPPLSSLITEIRAKTRPLFTSRWRPGEAAAVRFAEAKEPVADGERMADQNGFADRGRRSSRSVRSSHSSRSRSRSRKRSRSRSRSRSGSPPVVRRSTGQPLASFAPGTRFRGTATTWNLNRGFGFIKTCATFSEK